MGEVSDVLLLHIIRTSLLLKVDVRDDTCTEYRYVPSHDHKAALALDLIQVASNRRGRHGLAHTPVVETNTVPSFNPPPPTKKWHPNAEQS